MRVCLLMMPYSPYHLNPTSIIIITKQEPFHYHSYIPTNDHGVYIITCFRVKVEPLHLTPRMMMTVITMIPLILAILNLYIDSDDSDDSTHHYEEEQNVKII